MKAEDALAEIVRAVARGPGHVVDALRIAVKATRSRAGVVWRREGENLRPADAHGLADDALARMGAQRIQEGAPGAEKEAARARRTIHVPALALHPLAGGTTDALARGGLTSLLAVPLVEAGEAVGVLALYGAGPFDAQESAEAERLAPALALAVRLETLRADVAGRVRGLEAEVASRTKDLAAARSEMEAFLAGAAHDLRAPLVAATGFAEAAAEDLEKDPAAARDALTRVAENARRAEALAEALLEVARLGRVPTTPTDVALAPLLARVRDAEAPLFEAAGGRIEVDAPAGAVVVGDADRLERAFRNLAVNARKHRHAERPPTLMVSVVRAGDAWDVRFVDNGRGFPPSFRPRLFVPFARADSDGAGLGLALVRRVVDAHRGTVRGDAEPGKGATFIVSLPARSG